MPNKRGEVRWLGGRSRGSRDSESKTRRTVMKDSPLLKWELAPVLLPPCRRSGCSGSGSPRSTGPAAPAALVPRKRPRRPRPPLASVVAILPAPPPAKATIVAIVPRCTPPKERAPPRPAFQVLFLLSPCPPAYCKKKKRRLRHLFAFSIRISSPRHLLLKIATWVENILVLFSKKGL